VATRTTAAAERAARRRWRVAGPGACMASLLLHALAAGLLLLGSGDSPPPAVDEAPLEVEIVERPPHMAPQVPAAVPAQPAAAPPARARAVAAPAAEPRASRPPAAPAPSPESPAAAAAPSPPAQTSPVDDPSGTLSFPGPRSLLPSADPLGRAGIALPAAPAAGKQRQPGPSRWQRELGRVEGEDRARAAVEAGQAPPALFDLLRDAQRFHAPTRELLVTLAKAHAGRARNPGRWLGRYLGGFLSRERDLGEDEPYDDLAAFKRGVAAGALDFATRVCVDLDGSDPEPTPFVDRSSGVPALDREAVAVVARAARRRAREIDRPTRGCYRISVLLTRVPPLPVLSCGLNEDTRPACIYPLKEIARTRVTLDGSQPRPPPPVAGNAGAPPADGGP
jgi:outer membrane biosynthesis protein TonB